MITNFCCVECGSHQIADQDGYYVCCGCGLVIEEPVIQYNWGGFKTDKRGNPMQCHAILVKSTDIGNNSERNKDSKLRRLNKINRSLSNDCKDEAVAIFNQLRAHFEINLNLSHFMKMFNNVYSKMQPKSKSRNINLFCTTIFYIVINKTPQNDVSLKNVLKHTKIDLREYFICAKAISIEDPDVFSCKTDDRDNRVNLHISKIVDEFKLPGNVSNLALKISQKFQSRLGYKSRIIAGSALSIAMRIISGEKKISVFQISQALNVTASTIYARINGIDVKKLKERYLIHLSAQSINSSTIPTNFETIQAKTKVLEPDVVEIDVSRPRRILPVIQMVQTSKRIKKRTSSFIKQHQEIFSRYISTVSWPFKFKSPEMGIKPNISEPLRLEVGIQGNMGEFLFSPPIT